MNSILNPNYVPLRLYNKYSKYNIKLLHDDQHKEIVEHFMRLNKDDRYLRFNSHVNRYSLDLFMKKISKEDNEHYFIGYYDSDHILRGVSHLTYDERPLFGCIGISVETEFQGKGIGFSLLLTTTSFSRDHNIRWINMEFAYNNYKIISWIKRAGFKIKRDGHDLSCLFSTKLEK